MTLRLTRRSLLASSALALLPLPLSRASFAQDAPRAGGTLTGTIGFPEPHAMFVPGGGGGSPNFTASKVLEPLVVMLPDGSVRPALATAWSVSADFKSYTLQLRENVKWHDGKPFTADDVAFSIMDYWKVVSAIGIIAMLDRVEIKSPHSVVVHFTATIPEFSFLSTIATDYMIPKHIYAGEVPLAKNPTNNAPIGTGPWKFKEWARGRYAEFSRFEDYWDKGRPYPERLIVRWWREASARAAALESGALDIGTQNPVPMADIKRLQANPNFVITTDGYDGIPWQAVAIFNTQSEVTKNPAVRRALLHAIDREYIANTIYYGMATPAKGVLASANAMYFNADVPTFEFDPKKAAQLLDEAGAKAGADGTRFTIRLVAAGWVEENGKVGRYLQQAFGDVGVKVVLEIPDRLVSLRKIYTDYDFDLAISNHGAPLDPAPQTTRCYTKSGITKGMFFRNASRTTTPELEELEAKLTVETDAAERKALIHKFAVAATLDAAHVPIVEVLKATVARARVKDHSKTANESTNSWAEVWIAS
jgi:peptide/nickel transport system substrate-binding protein